MTTFRRLPQLRVTVNSRCERACFYCRPSGEAVSTLPRTSINPDVLIRICEVFAKFDVQAVKITGGDPALWGPLVTTVGRLKHQLGFAQVHVISRHPKIGSLALGLARAGLDLLNISIDTLDFDLHKKITGRSDLPELLDALHACVASGIPCKVNTVVMKGVNDSEIDALIEFCADAGVRTIKLLDMIQDLEDGTESYKTRIRHLPGVNGDSLRDLYTPLAPIVEGLMERAVEVRPLHQGNLGHPMLGLMMPSGLEVVTKDHRRGAWYGSICTDCPHYPCHDALMAVRITSDLRLQYCLLREDVVVQLAPLLRSGNEALKETIIRALNVYDTATFHSDPEISMPLTLPILENKP